MVTVADTEVGMAVAAGDTAAMVVGIGGDPTTE